MKKILLLILLAISTVTFGQTKRITNSLSPITILLQREALNYGIFVLTRAQSVSYDEIKDKLKLNLSRTSTPQLIRKNRIVISKYIDGAATFGESQNEYFIDGENNLGIDFGSFNNQNVFMQSGIVYKYSLNTLKLNADERAARVAKDVLLPGLSNFQPLLSSPDINYFCLVSGFIARDFGEDEDSVAYKDGEIVSIVISKQVLKKYINAEITDEQVFKLASFYNANKATKGIRKIAIK